MTAEFDFDAAAATFNKERFVGDLLKLSVTSEDVLSPSLLPKNVHIGTDFEPDDAAAFGVLSKAGVTIQSIVLIERHGDDQWDRKGRLDAFVAQNKAAYGDAKIRLSDALGAHGPINDIVDAHVALGHGEETLTIVWLANVLPVYEFLRRAKESGEEARTKIDFFIYGSVNLRWAVKMLAAKDGVSVEEARLRLMSVLHQAPSSGYTVHLFESYPMFCDVTTKKVLSVNNDDTPEIIAQLKENGQSSDSAFLLQQMADWNKDMLAWQIKSVSTKHAGLAHVTVDNIGENLDLLKQLGDDKETPEALARSIRLTHRIAKTVDQMVFADEALAIAIVTGFAFTPVKAVFTESGFVQVSTFALSDSTTEPLLWYSVRPTVFTGEEMFYDFAGHYLALLKK
jgi:hypothetical protein